MTMTKDELATYITRRVSRGITLPSNRSHRVDMVIHCTDLYNFCLRKYVLATKNNIILNSERRLPLATKVTYKLGTLIEKMVLESLRDDLVGKLSKCSSCGQLRYSAPLFRVKVGRFEIIGHPDCVIRIDGIDYILEIKSIDKDRYNDFIEPELRYLWQTMTYIYLKKKLRMRSISDTAFLIYVSKGQNRAPIKVVPVEMDNAYLKTIRAHMREIKTFSKKGLPERVCNNSLFPMALKCPVKDFCFKKKGGKKK